MLSRKDALEAIAMIAEWDRHLRATFAAAGGGIKTAKKLKHPRRKPVTPNSQIRSALRQLWLRSRERGQAVKDQHNTCVKCGRKGSAAKGREVKINVHHIAGVDWDGVIQLIRERLLQTPDKYVCMCEECHVKHHKKGC